MDPSTPPAPQIPPAAPAVRPDFAARAAAAFNSALDLPDQERKAFIDAECQGDEDLQQQVARLLAAHEQAGDFLGEGAALSPELEAQMARLKPEEAGDRIGPYKLLQQIGEGGFGVVWMADQEQPVRRRVALKIIKLGMDTREVIARFEQERQALAMMEHPNIAKVLDAGATQFGRPFFVMELVRGIKITDYCDQANLPTAKRLELFMQVCQAVQHAHQKGIIHRDLKPSNILVTLHDGIPVPKVIDFGVAKATQQQRLTDMTLFTQFEQMIGTPLYMSPEQAELSGLDIDTRSDIYSLGVLLYELLTGRTPFDPEELMRKGYDEIRRAIREQEPQKPSTFLSTMALDVRTGVALHRQSEGGKLAGLIRGDLDWIVMKALEKDRSRRYETANGFALDIQRHLKNEPVLARPPSKLYQFRRFVKRNKGAFAAGTAIALAVLVGLATSVWQAVRANAALDDLRASAPAFAAQARGLVAKEQFDQAIEKLDYAIKLRPDNAEYLLAKADLLECQLRFAEAAAVYRAAAQLDPKQARAAVNVALCEKLAGEQAAAGNLSRESLLQLLVAMAGEHRSAAEMLPTGRLISDEKKFLIDAWLERLKDLPIPPRIPLAQRLTMGNDGLLELDLSGTPVADLSSLQGMPLGVLNLSKCPVADLGPLRGLPLKVLYLQSTKVADFSPLAGLSGLTSLHLGFTGFRDLAPLRDLALERLDLSNTQVAEIALLHGMPLKRLDLRNSLVGDVTPLKGLALEVLDCTAIPAVDFSVLAGAPIEQLFLQNTRVADLSFLRGMPLKMLALNSCPHARGFEVLGGLALLETLLLPESYLNLPREDLLAIASLRGHAPLRQIEIGVAMEGMLTSTTGSAGNFWKAWDRDMTCILELQRRGVKFKAGRRDDKSLYLSLEDSDFADLDLCRGANITYLILRGTKIQDLKAAAKMPLKLLELYNTPITDLGPLGELPLYSLKVTTGRIRDISVLESAPLKASLHNLWLEDVLVSDYRALAGCKNLQMISLRNTPLDDIGVLRGLPLEQLYIAESPVKDLSPVEGMPLEICFFGGTQVTDLRPLLKCPGIKSLLLSPVAVDVEPLRALKKLERISYAYDPKLEVPTMTAAEFWADKPRREAQKLNAAGEFDAAAKTFREALANARKTSGEHSPAIVPALLDLANCYAWNGRYREAAPLFREMIELLAPARKPTPNGAEMLDHYSLAIVQAAAGDNPGYRAACATMLRRCEANKDEGVAERALLYCSLVPGSGAPEATLKALAATSAPMAKTPLAYWYNLAIGIAEYRAGNLAVAAETLKKVEAFENSSASFLADITLAMISHKTGDKADAAARLKRVRAGVANHWPLHQDRVNDVRNWQNWLAADLLVKEAAAMIEPTGGNGK